MLLNVSLATSCFAFLVYFKVELNCSGTCEKGFFCQKILQDLEDIKNRVKETEEEVSALCKMQVRVVNEIVIVEGLIPFLMNVF